MIVFNIYIVKFENLKLNNKFLRKFCRKHIKRLQFWIFTYKSNR